MTTFKFSHVISVKEEGSYPFNLRFGTSLKDPNLVNGPGIYIIALDDKPIYVGKHQPIGNSVFDRWLKSFETLTFRGCRLGFGKRDKNAVMRAIEPNSKGLANAMLAMPEEELNKHFRDRGVNTSVNGTDWVARHWEEHFKNGNDVSVLSSLSFAYIKLTDCSAQEKGKEIASALERKMFDTYDFEINFNSIGKVELNSLDDAIDKALTIASKKWPDANAQLTVKLTK